MAGRYSKEMLGMDTTLLTPAIVSVATEETSALSTYGGKMRRKRYTVKRCFRGRKGMMCHMMTDRELPYAPAVSNGILEPDSTSSSSQGL